MWNECSSCNIWWYSTPFLRIWTTRQSEWVFALNFTWTSITLSSGKCTKLHPAWFYLTTDTTFSTPIEPGTRVTVKCNDGFANKGSEIITCQNKIHYKFDTEPSCEPTGKIPYVILDQPKRRNFLSPVFLHWYEWYMNMTYITCYTINEMKIAAILPTSFESKAITWIFVWSMCPNRLAPYHKRQGFWLQSWRNSN